MDNQERHRQHLAQDTERRPTRKKTTKQNKIKQKQTNKQTNKNTQHRKLNDYLPSPLENQLYVHTEN